MFRRLVFSHVPISRSPRVASSQQHEYWLPVTAVEDIPPGVPFRIYLNNKSSITGMMAPDDWEYYRDAHVNAGRLMGIRDAVRGNTVGKDDGLHHWVTSTTDIGPRKSVGAIEYLVT